MTPSHDDLIEITVNLQERILFRPERTSMLIAITEWDSLLSRVKACKVSFRIRVAAYSFAFALGITAALSVIPMYFAQVPLWVLVAYGGVSLCGLVAGVILVIDGNAIARNQQTNIDDLVADMEKRRAPFSNPPPEPPEPEATLS